MIQRGKQTEFSTVGKLQRKMTMVHSIKDNSASENNFHWPEWMHIATSIVWETRKIEALLLHVPEV